MPLAADVSAVADASACVDRLLQVDPHGQSDETQIGMLYELVALDNKLQALKARWVQAADAADVTVSVAGRQTKRFLVEELMLEPGVAGREMRLARRLPFARLTADTLAAGDINTGHALLILKVLEHVSDEQLRAGVEEELVKLALDHPPFVVARAVDQILAMVGAESSAAAHARRYAERGVGLDEKAGGAGSLSGTLTPLLREKLALYFASKAQKAGPEDDRTQRQRQHDALEDLVDFGLSDQPDMAPVHGERPRVVVHIPYELLAGLVQDHEAVATLGSGIAISPVTARRLACDAQILPAVLGSDGEVLDIGGLSRTPTAGISRATHLRDGGRCTFPGCGNTTLRQHHMKYWSEWHQTSYDVMAWVCSFHHWLVHEGGWTMRRERGRHYVWTSPTGKEVRTPRHRGAGCPSAPPTP